MFQRLTFRRTQDKYLHISAYPKLEGIPRYGVHLNDEVFGVLLAGIGLDDKSVQQLSEAAHNAMSEPYLEVCCNEVDLSEAQLAHLRLVNVQDTH